MRDAEALAYMGSMCGWKSVVFVLTLRGKCFMLCVMTTDEQLLCYETQCLAVGWMKKCEG